MSGAGVLLTHDNRALFLKRSDKAGDHVGEWCCPGGSIEDGETPEQAARRELQEETGLTGLLTGDFNLIDEGDGFVTFRQAVGEEPEPTLDDEHVEARWAPMDSPPQPLHPGVAATLKKVLVGSAEDADNFDPNQPRDKNGMWSGGSKNVLNEAQGKVQVERLHKTQEKFEAARTNVHTALTSAGFQRTEHRNEGSAAATRSRYEKGPESFEVATRSRPVKQNPNATSLSNNSSEYLMLVRHQKKAADGSAHDRREYDDNGWFEVFDNPISSVGVYEYSEASVVEGGDPRKLVGVFRPPEELGSPETINSFRLMPWTDDHPEALLGDEAKGFVPAEKKGVHGVIGEKVYFQHPTLYGNLKVFSESLKGKIPGKRELSCGYHCTFVRQDGVYEGKPYQYVQKNMRGNHVSSVDAGRMGAGVRVMDAAPMTLSFALDLKETVVDAMDWNAYPSYTLAQLEQAVAEGRGTPAMVKEIAERKSGASKIRVTPQIAPPSSGMTPFAIKVSRDDGSTLVALDTSDATGQEIAANERRARENSESWRAAHEQRIRETMRKQNEQAAQWNKANPNALRKPGDPRFGRDMEEEADCLDGDTLKFIEDSFESLVGQLEAKGYSKGYATKVAGKVAAEKGDTGHHQSTDGDTAMAEKTPEELKKEADDRKAARDAKRSGLDAARAKDGMTSEEEEATDASEAACDAEEEKDDEKDEGKDARDRKSARDRRAGARDARKSARDRRAKDAAKDAAAQAARDAAAAAAKGKGMDAAEVSALVQSEVAKAVAAVGPTLRREEAAKNGLYVRLSPIIGAFDAADMTLPAMAAYGLKKLGVTAEASDPVTALDFLLMGRSQAAPSGAHAFAQDAAPTSVDSFFSSLQ